MSIVVENVSYRYAAGTPLESAALKQISFTIQPGEFIGILGHTGCGKSTLIQLIAGVLTPATGRILLDGKDINQRDFKREYLRKKVGIVFQFPEQQLFEMTVERDVSFGPRQLGLPPSEVQARTRQAIQSVGLDYETVRDLSPLTLSGGEKRRAAIAGILAMEPEILILDEPIAGLDPVTRKDFMAFIRRLHQEGKTILMVSHDIDELSAFSSRLLVLDHGELILDNTPEKIFADKARLSGLRLGVSQPKEIVDSLREKGIDLPSDIFRYEPLLTALINRFGGQNE